ncbi:MAG: macrolide transporter ATP-binding/permease protein [Verrucomicrobiales bacterium]|nr:macrolide transporter ATP-binding/permease protein [Verrucomicrobiales bacterium]
MRKLRGWIIRFGGLFKKQGKDAELDREIESHLQMHVEDNLRLGMSPEEARRKAMIKLGGVESTKENYRDQRGLPLLEIAMQDLRYGLRQLRKNPGFTLVAILTLALGIGANTAIFSVVNSVLLRPLSYPESNRLLWVSERTSKSRDIPISFPNFTDWQAQQTVFEQIGVYNWGSYNLVANGDPMRLNAAQMSVSAFAALRAQPVLGRVFTRDEDVPGAPHVVVLSHALWHDRFGGNSAILNQSVNLDGDSYIVVGVMPAGFVFPTPVDIWVPLGPFSSQEAFQNRDSHPGLEGVARLKSGVTLEQARAEMDTIATRLEQQYPGPNTEVRVRLDPLLNKVVGNVGPALWTLLGAVALVLLIACANVANLLLARAATRQKEMAVRAALGAGRWGIVRQLLTESLLLALVGGALGLLLGHWGLNLILSFSRNAIPRAAEIGLDSGVLIFTALASVLTGVLFGLAPAWQASRSDVQDSLKDTARGSTGGNTRMRQGLIVAEVALTLMLLIGAGLLLRSFHRLQTVNSGFSHERVASFRLDLPKAKYATPDQQNRFYQALIEKLRGLPGVQAAGIATRSPLQPYNELTGYRIVGQPEPQPADILTTEVGVASPDYFRAMGIQLLRGRYFTDLDNREHLRGSARELDTEAGLNVIIVDEEFVRRHWPNEDPIGRQIRIPWGEPGQNPVLTVVGVVARVKIRELSEHGGFVQVYLPAWQFPGTGRAVVMKTALPPESLFSAVREQVRSLDPGQPISNLSTIEELRHHSLAPQRLNLTLLGLFAAVALSLAVIGLYGVLSYAVTQRRREIGLRVALGAQRRDVLGLVVGNGMRLVTLGVVVGLMGAGALMHVLRSLLFEVTPFDPLTFAFVPVVLSAVALLACWAPARRAAAVDPMIALRNE